MKETSARLLKLLSLLQIRREWTAAALAERLGITDRTVRRDIEKLRDLGYPVDATRGSYGSYRLGQGANMPPLLLDDDEAVAVAVGLGSAASTGVSGLAESSVKALAKLDQVLPSRLRRRVRALRDATVQLATNGPAIKPDTLVALASACRDSERLRFGYTAWSADASSGTRTGRLVEPHRLVHTGRIWYLVAWDLDRDAWRTFRVDRIDAEQPIGQRFSPRDLSDAEVERLTSVGISTGAYRYQGLFTFHASAETVREVVSASSGRIEPLTADTCSASMGANSLPEMAIHLTLLGFDFEVHEPMELIGVLREVRDRMDRAITLAGRSPGC